jgi:hypothetical protein
MDREARTARTQAMKSVKKFQSEFLSPNARMLRVQQRLRQEVMTEVSECEMNGQSRTHGNASASLRHDNVFSLSTKKVQV